MADEAYSALQAQARQADEDGDLDRADGIRTALETISRQAAEALRKLSTQVGLAPAPATHPSRREPLHQPIAPTIRGLVPVAGWPETGGFFRSAGSVRRVSNRVHLARLEAAPL